MSAITFFVSFQLSIFLVVSFVLIVSVLVVFVVLIVLVLVVSVLLVVHNFTSSLGFENSFCSLSKTIPVSPTGN